MPGHRITVVLEGQSTPNGIGIFSSLHSSAFCLNNAGQVAFTAGLDVDLSNNVPIEEHGIFFFDETRGLFQVAREHDPLLGSTITALRLAGTSLTPSGGVAPAENSGLNEKGDVAFGFTLADGREGIAIWTLNPPSSDFNGDLHPDWVLQNPTTRQTKLLLMNDATQLASYNSSTLPLGWSLIDVDQFGLTRSADFLLFNSSTRQTAVWYMNGAGYFSGRAGPMLDSGYTLVLSQDFNGDSQPDLLLFNSSRQTRVWYLNSLLQKIGEGAGPTVPVGYKVVASADFDGDTKPDLLLSNGAGTVVWYLNGLQRVNSLYGPTLPAGWMPSAVDDFNRDGHPDLAITNASTHQERHLPPER